MLERRRERRVPVHFPVLVRGTDGDGEQFEENTTSENLCRGGVGIPMRHGIKLGTHLEISIVVKLPGTDPESAFNTQGRVVHVMRGRTAAEQMIGVEFTGPRFHHVVTSESTT
jgi:c-di-GMP-binding flagellar brake protein YcgR